MANYPVKQLLDLATNALIGQGFPRPQAESMAMEFIAADLSGTKTHGLGKLVSLNFGNVSAKPEITVAGPLITCNGNGGSGFLVMREVASVVTSQCEALGVAIAFAHNFSRYSSLYPYTELVAGRGFTTVLANNAGPSATAPFGGSDPVTGTNPICFSFPTAEGIQTFDFATSSVVWGEIRQAALEGRDLPPGVFLNAGGAFTTKPTDVNAVTAFGGAKGWAMNLALEIFCGALAGAKMGAAITNEFECGAFMLAVDPNASSGSGGAFRGAVSELLKEVRMSRPLGNQEHVRCPGDRERGAALVGRNLDTVYEIPNTTLSLLTELARGENPSHLSSNPLFN